MLVACRNLSLPTLTIDTGQHFDQNLFGVHENQLGLPSPDMSLRVGSASVSQQVAEIISKLEVIFLDRRPSLVAVFGDTNSTLAGALAAVMSKIPVVHIEAGLRSYNSQMTEELNRRMVDHVSDLLFAPTRRSQENLRAEGIDANKIHLVGDVMYDAVNLFAGHVQQRQLPVCAREYPRFALATIHRAEAVDNPTTLLRVMTALLQTAKIIPVIMPIHPRTKKKLAALELFGGSLGNLVLTDPVGYLDMLRLLQSATVVITDSGGIQKEAFFLRKPCITLRNETEWVELIETGWNRLIVDADLGALPAAVQQVCDGWQPPRSIPEDFGDGTAAAKIAQHLRKMLFL